MGLRKGQGQDRNQDAGNKEEGTGQEPKVFGFPGLAAGGFPGGRDAPGSGIFPGQEDHDEADQAGAPAEKGGQPQQPGAFFRPRASLAAAT